MNCEEFQNLVHDWDREDALVVTVRWKALRHVESCRQCAARLDEAQALTESLKKLAEAFRAEEASVAMEWRLWNSFQARQAARRRKRLVLAWGIGGLATATGVAILLGFFLKAPARRASPMNQANQTEVANAPISAPAVPSLVSSQKRADLATPTRRRRTTQLQAEWATEFVALPGADDVTGLEGAALLRVEMSPVALASLGVPIGGDPDGSPVIADLIVSEDGVPQAVRLVRSGAKKRLPEEDENF